MNRLILILFIATSFLFAQDEFFEPKTTVGGYGELHYNWSEIDGADEPTKKLDFHRFVLFYSHAWTEKWSFKSEVELEHNFVNDGHGELELEQAYINYHHSEAFGFQVGVLLPSVGLINENHEPPLFLSVERPDYAKNVIPTTWFGNGAAVYGRINDFSYKAVVMEGLNGSKFSNGGIRSGRQKGYDANAQELLYNFRVNYTGVQGLLAGGSVSYNDAFVAIDSTISTTIFEIHLQYVLHNIHATFEYGNISFDGKDAGYMVENATGYYFDFGYNVASLFGYDGQFIPWFRYSDYNTAATVEGGGDAEKANHFSQWLTGISFKPISEVVFKVEYGIQTRDLGKIETKLFNLGAGYMF
jgi:hypothetical protein